MRAYSQENFFVPHSSILNNPYIRPYVPGLVRRNEKFTSEGGVMVRLPSGNEVKTDFLKRQAKPVIELGPQSVPYLTKWVRSDNVGVRYIAIYSLEEITNIRPLIYHMRPSKNWRDEEGAIQEWMNWWER
jgi:hypothetical protein